MIDRTGRRAYQVGDQEFIVDSRFQLINRVGHGSFGIICSARYRGSVGEESGSNVLLAVKKIPHALHDPVYTKRSLRELKLLRFFQGHHNVVNLFDADLVYDSDGNFNGLYLYEELLDCDLGQIIRSRQPLTDYHFQSFIYQTLCGLKFIHSAGVLYRDLKPGCLLITEDCHLKISDFGLARGYSVDPSENSQFTTEYVATRWYRAPEIMLNYGDYSTAIDVWSVGCILAELLLGEPLFKGSDYVNQLNRMLQILGTPDMETLQLISSPNVRNYILALGLVPKTPLNLIFPSASEGALDLLGKLLKFNPRERITVDEALDHSYLAIWHAEGEEPVCFERPDFDFEKSYDMVGLKDLLSQEVESFRELVRQPFYPSELQPFSPSDEQEFTSVEGEEEREKEAELPYLREYMTEVFSQPSVTPSTSNIRNEEPYQRETRPSGAESEGTQSAPQVGIQSTSIPKRTTPMVRFPIIRTTGFNLSSYNKRDTKTKKKKKK